MSRGERLWTVVLDPDTRRVVDCFDQAVPGCGMGPDTCGGCRDCMIAQAGEQFTFRYDVTDEELVKLGKQGEKEHGNSEEE